LSLVLYYRGDRRKEFPVRHVKVGEPNSDLGDDYQGRTVSVHYLRSRCRNWDVEFFEEFLFGDPRCGTGSHYCVLKDEEGRVLYDSQADVPLGWRIGSENVAPGGEPPRRKAPNRESVKLGGKYRARGIELTVTTKTDTANGGKSVSFCSEDGCTKGGMWIRDEVVTREKIQVRLDARRLATCTGCGRPYLADSDRFTDCEACQTAAWKAREAKAAQER
jgi:hypothetical protein